MVLPSCFSISTLLLYSAYNNKVNILIGQIGEDVLYTGINASNIKERNRE